MILAGDAVVDVELFVLNEDWSEVVVREATELELESEGGLDVMDRKKFEGSMRRGGRAKTREGDIF